MTTRNIMVNQMQQDLNMSNCKNLKPWLKSVFSTEEGEFHLKAIDLELANGLCLNEIAALAEGSHDDTALKLYAFLVIKLSQALSRGEVCIEISQLYDIQKKIGISLADVHGYLSQFATLHQVEINSPAELARLAQQNPYDLVINYPLVIMQGRLYFSRYWFYQQQVFFAINSRLAINSPMASSSDLADSEVNIANEVAHQEKTAQLSNTLQQLFPSNSAISALEDTQNNLQKEQSPNWQMLAAASACLNRFSVITGGPGTGKTTTVTRLLAALISQQPDLRIALAAPTGKAAARLVESILAAKTQLAKSFPLAEKIPVSSFTLHRLLGWRPDGFSYNHKKTLPYDLVIVDEASMVDLPMMAQLMESLGDNTRLILLGDKDQLASVEAGSVLGDLCDSGVMVNGYHAHGLQAQRAKQLAALCGLSSEALEPYIETDAPIMTNSLTQLRKSYRFTRDSGIGQLAAAVNAGRYDQLVASFEQYSDIQYYANLIRSTYSKSASYATVAHQKVDQVLPETLAAEQAWQQQVITGYGHYLKAIDEGGDPEKVLELFNRFQLLCALRQGSSGLHALNERIQILLQSQGLLKMDLDMGSTGQQRWYFGRPVMITRNDYELNLFNGDIGIAMMVANKELRVCFMADGKVRKILPTRLPDHETAFAMTVHKSQGSEFTDVALVLPENFSPVISRELIYTAITRAKSSFSLYSNAEVLEKGVSARIERASGLRDLLFKTDL